MKEKTIALFGTLAIALLLTGATVYAHGTTTPVENGESVSDGMMMDEESMDAMHEMMTKDLGLDTKQAMDAMHENCAGKTGEHADSEASLDGMPMSPTNSIGGMMGAGGMMMG